MRRLRLRVLESLECMASIVTEFHHMCNFYLPIGSEYAFPMGFRCQVDTPFQLLKACAGRQCRRSPAGIGGRR
jgi:hypothetical protein